MTDLAERLLVIDEALERQKLPHAFGGAIALAYCTLEPRGTRDIDVNVFVGIDQADVVLDALPDELNVRPIDRETVRRDGQVRLYWQDTPVDIFLDTHPFHDEISREVVRVPFEDRTIDVLGCEALLIFKAMFNRTRDWADIEAILEAGSVDGPIVLDRLRSLLGPSDPAVIRLRALVV